MIDQVSQVSQNVASSSVSVQNTETNFVTVENKMQSAFTKVYFFSTITSFGTILKVYYSILKRVHLAHLAHLINYFQIPA